MLFSSSNLKANYPYQLVYYFHTDSGVFQNIWT